MRQIEDFRGDFKEVAQLLEHSWGENAHQPLLYEADFLASFFQYPGADFSLAPTIYEGAAPVAFSAAFPRRVRLAGRDLNLAVSAFLTAASEYKKRGYGIVLWSELVKRLRAAGLDGMVNFCVEGESMNGMILNCYRLLRLPTAHALSIPYWSRVLQPKKPESAWPGLGLDVVEHFLELATPIAKQTPLARLWNPDEADWQCRRRFGSVVAEMECGPRRGMLVGYVMAVANASRTKCLMIDDVLWGGLEPQERESLVRVFLDRATLAGAQVAVLPVLGYADLSPFHAARFRPSRQILHAYVTVWNGEPFTDALPSMYIDVF
jgi:hypothetical protein